MSDTTVCCRQLPLSKDIGTPFHRIIGFGLYDGLTAGVAECQTCRSVYRFDMMDMVADRDASWDIRVFALAPLPSGSFDLLVAACPQPPGPDWSRNNVWVPKWTFSSKNLETAAKAQIDEILNWAQPAELVVASTPWGEKILAARKLTAEDLPYIQVVEWADDPRRRRDWVSFLGLVQQPNAAE
jgi:hypothetical protein